METAIAVATVAIAAILIVRSVWQTAKGNKRDDCACGGKDSCPAAKLCDSVDKKSETK